MARSRRSRPGAGQQPLFVEPNPAQAAPPSEPAPTQALPLAPASAADVDATVIDLPGAAALRSLRAGLGDHQVQLLPTDPASPAPPPAPPAPAPAPAASAPASPREPLRYGRWRLDGPTWELYAALAALRRDTLTGRDLRRHLAELEARPQAQPQAPAWSSARPQAQPAGGEAGSARG